MVNEAVNRLTIPTAWSITIIFRHVLLANTTSYLRYITVLVFKIREDEFIFTLKFKAKVYVIIISCLNTSLYLYYLNSVTIFLVRSSYFFFFINSRNSQSVHVLTQ